MNIKKHYNHRRGCVERIAELTKGEQYDLMKRNQELIKSAPKNTIKSGTVDDQGIDWQQIFDETVSYSDIIYVDSYPTESANLIFD